MKATLTFKTIELANDFAMAWSRHSKTGHIVGSGIKNVSVTVFDLTENDKEWINKYVNNLNK